MERHRHEQLTFRVTDSYGDYADLTVNINVRHPFDAWRAANFTAAELADVTVSGPNADPDKDGVPNLLEYALGGNPKTTPDGNLLPVLASTTVGPEERLTLTFTPQALAGLTYVIETSNNLTTWSFALDVTSLLTLGTPYTLTDTIDMLTNDRRFLLLRVDLAAPASGTVRTIPLGGVSMKIAPGTGIAKVTTPLSAPLLAQSSITGAGRGRISSITATTISSTGAGWVPGALSAAASPYVVRITNGSATGYTFLISANTADTLTIHSADAALTDLTTIGIVAGGPNPDTFEIIPCDTLLSLLGTPSTTGILGGSSAASADTVAVYSPHLGTQTYFYSTTTNQWVRNSFGFPAANDTPIRPDTGLQYQRLAATPTRQVYLGSVPSTARRLHVRNSSITLISSGWPVPVLLGSSAINSILGWVSATSPTTADIVSLGIMNFFHDGTVWRRQSFGIPIANPPIPWSSAVLLNKKGSATGHTIYYQTLPYTLP